MTAYQRPIQHGTYGGHRTHTRRGEQPCPACADAQRRYHEDRVTRNPPTCGTLSGFNAHHTRGEQPCNLCRETKAEYDAQMKYGRIGPIMFQPQPWARHGACRGADPELFFPKRGASLEPAKAICAECPVVDACREYAIANRETQGVWGGTSERERKRIRIERRKQSRGAA